MKRLTSKSFRYQRRIAFTLIELLIVMAIIGILAGLSAVVMGGAVTDAKVARTNAQLERINLLILERWESFGSRPLQYSNTTGTTSVRVHAEKRLWAQRELMRAEMPDRFSDFIADTRDAFGNVDALQSLKISSGISAVQKKYLRRYQQAKASSGDEPSPRFQGAECLYLILESIETEFGNGLDSFKASEIGDVDADGMSEILDAWGNPIEFIRWPAGFLSDLQPYTLDAISRDATFVDKYLGDPLDFLQVDPRNHTGGTEAPDFQPYTLFPLVYSAGPDEEYGLIDGFSEDDPPVVNFDPWQQSKLIDEGISNMDLWNTAAIATEARSLCEVTSGPPSGNALPVGLTAPGYPFNDPYIFEQVDFSLVPTTVNFRQMGTSDGTGADIDNLHNHIGVLSQ